MRAVWQTLAAILTLAPMLWLAASYAQLPDRVPVHWDLEGHPDRWAEKNFASVFLLAAVSLQSQLLVGLLIWDAERQRERSTSQPMRQSLTTLLQMMQPMRFAAGCLFVVLAIGFQSAHALGSLPSAALIASVVLLLGAGFVGAYRVWRAQLHYEESVATDAPEFQASNYRFGLFYCNPADENLLVHKRLGIGFTINFAHRRALVYVAVTGLLAVSVIAGALWI